MSCVKNGVFTIIVGDHGLWIDKNSTAEANIYEMHQKQFHIPMLIWGPDIAPSTNDQLASQLDITPTLVNLMKLPVEKHAFLGRDLLSDTVITEPFVITTGFNNIVTVEESTMCFPHINTSTEKDVYFKSNLNDMNFSDIKCFDRITQEITNLPKRFNDYKNLVQLNDYSLINGFTSP